MDCAIWKFTCSAIFIVRLVWVLLFLLGCLLFLLCLRENVLDQLMWFNFYSYFWLGFFIIEQGNMALFLCYCFEPFYFWASLLEMINVLFSQTCCWELFGFEEIRLLARQGGSYLFQQPIGIYCRNACMNIIFGIYFFLKRFIYFLDWTSLISISVWSILRWLCFNYCEYYLEKRVSIPTQRDAIRMTARLIAVECDPSTLINYIICLWICSGFPSQINSVCEIGCLFYSIFSCVLSCWSILWGQSCLKFIIFHRYRSLCLVIYSKYHIR